MHVIAVVNRIDSSNGDSINVWAGDRVGLAWCSCWRQVIAPDRASVLLHVSTVREKASEMAGLSTLCHGEGFQEVKTWRVGSSVPRVLCSLSQPFDLSVLRSFIS